ncbi:unnamed protein product [Miscanthus lutarioriparius]|uniref:Uncharacterized protein n=1 Tax=Miscanthus lutarioriparius TaxID=422564 RepID=A0A811RFL0_9POAL|nr:unnamed protein product [Miscanthus lutarioriparius]
MAAASTVSSLIPPPLPEFDDGNAADASGSGLVLLDRWCYIANLVNATRPPLVSHFCVHCPGLDFPNATPKVITTDADLVLLCVPVYPDTIGHGWDWDYFVYSLRARRLYLVPNPNHRCLTDSATVLLSDVLSESPVLHDVPLPVPARGNWNPLLMELDPYNFRDVKTETLSRLTILINTVLLDPSW